MSVDGALQKRAMEAFAGLSVCLAAYEGRMQEAFHLMAELADEEKNQPYYAAEQFNRWEIGFNIETNMILLKGDYSDRAGGYAEYSYEMSPEDLFERFHQWRRTTQDRIDYLRKQRHDRNAKLNGKLKEDSIKAAESLLRENGYAIMKHRA